jgi:hypothetical protein
MRTDKIPARFILLIVFIFISCAARQGKEGNAPESLLGGKPVTLGGEYFSSPDFFPILPWDPYHGFRKPFIEKRTWGLSSIRECNFTLAGFVRPEDLPLCEKLGLAAIMIDRDGFLDGKTWGKMPDSEIEGRVRRMVRESAQSPAVLGYFITDEPGAGVFPALAKAVQAVKKYAPGKLAYINLYPDYATLGAKDKSQLETGSYSEYLERFVAEVQPQFLSYDNYMVQYSQDLKDKTKAYSYYHNLLEMRRIALKYNLPFWNIVSANRVRPTTTIPSPANLAFQTYTTLAAGGKGVSWYMYYAGGYQYAPIDKTDHKTMTWYYLREVNHQAAILGPMMNRLTSTGVYFTSPTPVESLPVLPGRFVETIESDSPMMVGEFQGNDGAEYAMVVNLSLERSTSFKLKTVQPNMNVQSVSAADGSFAAMDSTGLWLTAGQGALVKIK